MAPPNRFYLVSVIFLSILSVSSLPTSAITPKANVSFLVPSSQLVENLCNGKAVQNRRFCLKAPSTPKVIAAMDTTQLGTLFMKLGAANAKVTLNVYNEIIKKPGSPQALNVLNCCVEAYKFAILSFEMVSSELVEDPQTANYDVAVIGPEIVSKDTAFWVRVLRSKYGMKVRVPESIASGMCSAVWIGLSKMCHHETKDLVHVLRNFPTTKEAWMQIMLANR
ncbi:hypothetical protein Godav_009390 [Gossypium davidsonii]|uniref:Pectinesterase inhibitor domain-containing protein n=1 Tax=Gossypium davidsonii TaxID=34287 RepID=A0A7J8SDM8_GOSDV|nr:hypothetical protein [Gossypium davidsonii]